MLESGGSGEDRGHVLRTADIGPMQGFASVRSGRWILSFLTDCRRIGFRAVLEPFGGIMTEKTSARTMLCSGGITQIEMKCQMVGDSVESRRRRMVKVMWRRRVLCNTSDGGVWNIKSPVLRTSRWREGALAASMFGRFTTNRGCEARGCENLGLCGSP